MKNDKSFSSIDILVVGGGITGAAVARDAAGRGYRVALLERGDLGGGTTSRSSRLAHGGLRYLEHGQVKMVREALRERDRLFDLAPLRARSVRFRMPLTASPRPAMMLSAGLFLYDVLAGSHTSRRERDGFSYLDGVCDPELLTVDLAADAARHGALIRTYTPVTRLNVDGVSTASGEHFTPRVTVLCAGPWTDRVLSSWGLVLDPPLLAPTRGSHILLDATLNAPPRSHPGTPPAPRLLQASSDGRVFFAIPWQGGTLIGTTDQDDASDPAELRPHEDEIKYLREEAGRHLPELVGAPLRGAWTGARPLVHSGQEAGARSRSELILAHPRRANLIVVAGGKLTTMRLMAERAVNMVERCVLDRPPRPWTATAPLPAAPTGFAVTRLSDVLLRRSYVGFATGRGDAHMAAEIFARAVGWDATRLATEWADFTREAKQSFGLEFP